MLREKEKLKQEELEPEKDDLRSIIKCYRSKAEEEGEVLRYSYNNNGSI